MVALDSYREEVLAYAPAIARHDPGGSRGVLFGYDFHVTEGGIALIVPEMIGQRAHQLR